MRYYKQDILFNNTPAYKRYLKERGLKFINHYATPKLQFPSAEDLAEFNTREHVWRYGDRFFRLAHQFYDDSTKWWVIAFFNQKPTEFHVKQGEVIYIPYPLENALFHMGY